MANNAIDKTLDEIITGGGISANSRKNGRNGARTTKKARGSLKSLGKALAASRQEPSKNAKKTSLSALANPLALAKRAVVSNLPFDIDEKAVAEYFGSRVGKIVKVEGSYRENGKPTGTYTLTFDRPGRAQVLLEKFHNELVDGKRRLSVQILLDATTAAPPTLDGRIGPISKSTGEQNSKRNNSNSNNNNRNAAQKKKKADAPRKAVVSEEKPKSKKAGKAAKKTKAKVQPRSKEDLDADMADYFSKAGDNEISV